MTIELTRQPIQTDELLSRVQNEDCGAVVLFIGTTRRKTKTGDGNVRTTATLYYDAYEPMAKKALATLFEECKQQWPIHAAGVIHRLGEVPVSQASIALAVSSPHRADGYAASVWLMDQIKTVVPIWKREIYQDGSEEWVHPGADES
jgi:molybdopterin synthase catalytic subunit